MGYPTAGDAADLDFVLFWIQSVAHDIIVTSKGARLSKHVRIHANIHGRNFGRSPSDHVARWVAGWAALAPLGLQQSKRANSRRTSLQRKGEKSKRMTRAANMQSRWRNGTIQRVRTQSGAPVWPRWMNAIVTAAHSSRRQTLSHMSVYAPSNSGQGIRWSLGQVSLVTDGIVSG